MTTEAKKPDQEIAATEEPTANKPDTAPEPAPETNAVTTSTSIKTAKVLQWGKTQVDAFGWSEATGTWIDVADEPRLQPFRDQYSRWLPAIGSKCTWAEIESRLLANNGSYLSLAEGLENAVLFGVDAAGNPLFADGGDQPMLEGMNYNHTRQRVVPTGYEMFPVGEELIVADLLDFRYYGKYHKSSEIKQFEAFTKKPFVLPQRGESWSSSWLGSGERPFGACTASFSTMDGQVLIDVETHPNDGRYGRGVRRLLRVKKTS